MPSTEFRAMNTTILLAAEGASDKIARGFGQAEKFIRCAEARLTRFAETSELSALNRAAGKWFNASDELFDLVREARDYFDQTQGLFDPTIIDTLESIGYDTSMDDIRAQGSITPPREIIIHTASSFRAVEFDPVRNAIRLPAGTRIDLGGIAKGWIAESAALLLADYADSCVVDAGGDMFMVGVPRGETHWQIEIEDPRNADLTLTVLKVKSGAVATSSITKRRWQQGKLDRHHLIDPRLNAPAETDWLSVTVIAPHATTAEVFAKAILIAGSREAQTIAARRDDIAFIGVDRVGKLWGAVNVMEYLNVDK